MNLIEQRIRAALEPLILGKERPAWRCCCGALGNGPARAVRLTAWQDDPNAGLVDRCAHTYAWSVEMVELADPSKGYGTSLRDFVSEEQIRAIFAAAVLP